MYEMINTKDGINSRLKFTNEKVEALAIETIQNETRRENRNKKGISRASVRYRTTSSSLICV